VFCEGVPLGIFSYLFAILALWCRETRSKQLFRDRDIEEIAPSASEFAGFILAQRIDDFPFRIAPSAPQSPMESLQHVVLGFPAGTSDPIFYGEVSWSDRAKVRHVNERTVEVIMLWEPVQIHVFPSIQIPFVEARAFNRANRPYSPHAAYVLRWL